MKLLAIFVAAICAGIASAQVESFVRPTKPVTLPPVNNCDIMCTMDYRPICGLPTNGCGECRTFSNGCMLGVYNCQNPGNQYYSYAGTACDWIGKSDPLMENLVLA